MVENRKDKDGLLGVPIKSGYQSHYVLVNGAGDPIDNEYSRYYDEVVIGQEEQVPSLNSLFRLLLNWRLFILLR